jgi:hypothetical protein
MTKKLDIHEAIAAFYKARDKILTKGITEDEDVLLLDAFNKARKTLINTLGGVNPEDEE